MEANDYQMCPPRTKVSPAQVKYSTGSFAKNRTDAQLLLLMGSEAASEAKDGRVSAAGVAKVKTLSARFPLSVAQTQEVEWSQRGSNPCYRRERPVS